MLKYINHFILLNIFYYLRTTPMTIFSLKVKYTGLLALIAQAFMINYTNTSSEN